MALNGPDATAVGLLLARTAMADVVDTMWLSARAGLDGLLSRAMQPIFVEIAPDLELLAV